VLPVSCIKYRTEDKTSDEEEKKLTYNNLFAVHINHRIFSGDEEEVLISSGENIISLILSFSIGDKNLIIGRVGLQNCYTPLKYHFLKDLWTQESIAKVVRFCTSKFREIICL
jgi:hypothetical protein